MAQTMTNEIQTGNTISPPASTSHRAHFRAGNRSSGKVIGMGLLGLLLTTPVAAQQQPQQQSASQVAHSIGEAAYQMGQVIEAQQKQIEALTKEHDELKAKLPPEAPKP